MIENPIYFCVEPDLPLECLRVAQKIAIAENSLNATPFEAAINCSRLWKPGRCLRVVFLEGWFEVQQKVILYAQQWSNYANIHFLFTNDLDAEIRISFDPYQPSWSAKGTEALVTDYFPPEKPTMNLNCLTVASDDQQYSRTVLHEFGHALGLIHEHQSPAGGIQWNKEAALQVLLYPPYNWTLEAVQKDLFDCDQTQTRFSQFDPASIMIYPIPAEWTLNRLSFVQNVILSETDKQFIGICYPL